MTISERRMILISYIEMKLKERDWHGVADAAMDLRELEIESRMVKEWDRIHDEVRRPSFRVKK